MIKIAGIDMGHTKSGANYGAVGIIKESEETRVVGNKVIAKLKKRGITVVNCTVDSASSNSESINKRVKNANAQTLDLFVSIHFNNSGNGKGEGVEVLTYKGNKLPEAERVLKNMESLKFRNRGVKDALTSKGERVGVVYRTKWRAMLVEVCFCDSKSDVEKYKANIDAIAEAIVCGITGEVFSATADSSDKIELPTDPDTSKNSIQMPDDLKIASCDESTLKDFMISKIKELEKVVGIEQDGVATNEIVNKLPELKGSEQRGCVTIMQQILIAKGFLSKDSDTGIIGPANRNALSRFKKENGIPEGDMLVDRLTWRKLLEY